MRIEIQLRIVADDNSVISEGEILHFDNGDDRLEVIGLSFDEARAALAGIQGGTAQAASFLARHRSHYAYYGVTGNGRRLRWYANQVGRIWKKWLSRRGRPSAFTWNRFNEFLKRHPLPPARIVHRYAAVSEALS